MHIEELSAETKLLFFAGNRIRKPEVTECRCSYTGNWAPLSNARTKPAYLHRCYMFRIHINGVSNGVLMYEISGTVLFALLARYYGISYVLLGTKLKRGLSIGMDSKESLYVTHAVRTRRALQRKQEKRSDVGKDTDEA